MQACTRFAAEGPFCALKGIIVIAVAHSRWQERTWPNAPAQAEHAQGLQLWISAMQKVNI